MILVSLPQKANANLGRRIALLNHNISNTHQSAPKLITYQATCQIDNDNQFDYDQTDMGQLTGTLSQIRYECYKLAQSIHGEDSSAGISNIKLISSAKGLKSAVCHIDDDINFNYDQATPGRLYGTTIDEITSECQKTAYLPYKEYATSGLKEIRL